MIIYFADRTLNILGHASTELKQGLRLRDDKKTEETETGVAIFECKIEFDDETRAEAEEWAEVGNYVLRKHKDDNELYTIIDSELDVKKQTLYIYAEDDGMDLLNEVVGEYEADAVHTIEYYVKKYAESEGFVIGINEDKGTTLKLSFDNEQTKTARINAIAAQFGMEISFSFKVNGLNVVERYINLYRKRGKDNGTTLYLGKEIDNIVISKTISNLATALKVTGDKPEGEDDPITLKGYSYDDGDIYVEKSTGVLKSRKALARWKRYLWKTEVDFQEGGHIRKLFNYKTTDKATLCSKAVAELKLLCDAEVNYDAEIKSLPDNVEIGDRVNIVDDKGELYLSTRFLKHIESVVDQTHKATLGEHLIKSSGIHQKVLDLAEKFAENAKSSARALTIAQAANTTAQEAKTQAETAATEATSALTKATEAETAANTAQESATVAQEAANNAQVAVDNVETQIEGIETSVANAEAAAKQAEEAAASAETKATEAQTSATNAETKATEAKTAATEATTKAEEAISKADSAEGTAASAVSTAEAAETTANAAKLDAEAAKADVASLSEDLTTLSNTMSADYARKTELTETEASLQTQISQNAAQIQSHAESITTIDETANNAAEQAAQAQTEAQAAQTKADEATSKANAAQTAADEAAASATSAQTEADNAKAAAEAAQSVADKAESDLEAAKADLATVQGRVDATEEEIAAAQAAVNTAQAAADKANADATAAANAAASAQTTADTAVTNAAAAQTKANEAATAAANAQATADAAQGDATAAITAANEAKANAAAAQSTADTAKTNAATAQSKADAAATAAANAQAAADEADAKAAQAAADLATAQQNLADVSAKADATEAELAEAQAAVDKAQAAADTAKANAEAAQSTADTAKANAATAQAKADEAKTAADNAQAKADEAQAAADAAQEAVDALAIRVTKAETDIIQTSEQIALLATKEEVKTTLGGYYTKTETDAAISVKADEINLSVDSKIEEGVNPVQNTADNALSGLAEAQAQIQILADSIAQLVRDGNGGSLVKQDSNGFYYFDISEIDTNISDTASNLNDLEGIVTDLNGQIDVLKSTAEALQSRTEYVKSYTDENDQPCLELGEGDSKYKAFITNTSIILTDGTTNPIEITQEGMATKKVTTDAVQMNVFLWVVDENGHLVLTEKESEE